MTGCSLLGPGRAPIPASPGCPRGPGRAPRVPSCAVLALVAALGPAVCVTAQVDDSDPDGLREEAGHWAASPTEVSPEPLMIAMRLDDRAGGRWFEYDLWQPMEDGVRVVVSSWQRVSFLRRLGRSRVLVSRSPVGRVFVLDLESGAREPVFPGGEQAGFLRCTERAIWYRSRIQGRDLLFVQPLDARDSPRPAFEESVARTLGWQGGRALVQSAKDAEHYWIDGTNEPERVEMKDRPEAGESSISPDGRWLAVAGQDTVGFEPRLGRGANLRRLTVHDLELGHRVWQTELDVQVSIFSSFLPELKAAWVDARTLRASETFVTDSREQRGGFRFVDWTFPGGERVAESTYSESLGLYHSDPTPGPIDRPVHAEVYDIGPFTWTPDGLLWASGAMAYPMGEDKDWFHVALAPSGMAAVICQPGNRPLTALDPTREHRWVISEGKYQSAEWVPE